MILTTAITLATVGAGYAAVVGVMYKRQRALLYHVSTTRPALDTHDLPRMREVDVRTRDGLDLLAWYAPPTGAERRVIVFFHGNAGTLDNRADKMRRYLDHQFGALALSWRGFGGNPGNPSEEGLYADADAAIAFLGQFGHSAEDIVLYGESLGTAVATRCAVHYPASALVLESPPLSIVKMGQLRYPWLPVGRLTKDRFETDQRIGDVSCPLLILHGRQDHIVPFEMGQQLAAMTNGHAEFCPIDEAHHTNMHEYGAADRVISFLGDTAQSRQPQPLDFVKAPLLP